ncbi:MAG: methylenetetrahydrofolate reductase [Cellulosilyticaceae bacterium]
MHKISIELVPRSKESLEKELMILKNHFTNINRINIPDLLKFELRSWDACSMCQSHQYNAIPHLRAIDFDILEELPFKEYFLQNNIKEVLVLSGDLPQDLSRRVYNTNTIDFIRKIKQEMPQLKIYAGIDPYRGSIQNEFEYIKRKLYAGCDGFFTQPFFDLRFLEVYADYLEGTEVYWGISPVTSEASQSYWQTKNKAIFPRDFKPTLEWNIAFAKQALNYAKKRDINIYFMPIRTDLREYLEAILK